VRCGAPTPQAPIATTERLFGEQLDLASSAGMAPFDTA
jgi:hypothetical protein